MLLSKVAFLGPQRHDPNLGEVVNELDVHGRLALVTAGWMDREDEDGELNEHLGGNTVNLGIYARVEAVFQEDPELLQGMRDRHDRLRRLQEVYRSRLEFGLECARDLLRRDGPPELLDPERSDAIEEVRRLDAHHLERVEAVHAEFREVWRIGERDSVVRQRDEVRALLEDCAALCIAGGHVAVLLNRLRLLHTLAMVGERPVIAWSAGAMALSERIVLFHDRPPQGPGNAEILDAGLRRCTGIVPLPHASSRLQLDDPTRVGLFARRFGPDLCAVLDRGAHLNWSGDRWKAAHPSKRLTEHGELAEVEA